MCEAAAIKRNERTDRVPNDSRKHGSFVKEKLPPCILYLARFVDELVDTLIRCNNRVLRTRSPR